MLDIEDLSRLVEFISQLEIGNDRRAGQVLQASSLSDLNLMYKTLELAMDRVDTELAEYEDQ